MLKAHIDFGSAPAMMRHKVRRSVSTLDLLDVPVLREGVSECQLLLGHVIDETRFVPLVLRLIVDLSCDKGLIVSYCRYLTVV